jgi:hypothetical protein
MTFLALCLKDGEDIPVKGRFRGRILSGGESGDGDQTRGGKTEHHWLTRDSSARVLNSVLFPEYVPEMAGIDSCFQEGRSLKCHHYTTASRAIGGKNAF